MLRSGYFSQNYTGLVFAGFGKNEKFPTLISFEIDGILSGRIKYRKKDEVDIDREGIRAAIRPFAQKDMVDRFLHGLDDEIQKKIVEFCSGTIKGIGLSINEKLTFENDADRNTLLKIIEKAENEFINQLRSTALVQFKGVSVKDIEGMVEFMPKPDLARTAEALIDLTSIKRKVSVGMETVGGPVDVAVISRSEGFVWVKRKHYFPSDLNMRYFERKKLRTHTGENHEKE